MTAPAASEPSRRRDDPDADADLGLLLWERGDRAGAEVAFRRADERGHAGGALCLGMLLEDRDELAAAEAAYRRSDVRGHAGGAFNLGVLLSRRGDEAGAEAAYRRADQRGEGAGRSTSACSSRTVARCRRPRRRIAGPTRAAIPAPPATSA